MPTTHTPLTTSPIRSHYDVVIIGARAAGAATAMLLARNGLRVLAVDRSRYGSDTLSTHALMRGAVTHLHRWGLLPTIWEAGTPVISRTTFTYDEAEFTIDIPRTPDAPGLAAPRRTVLDPILVDAAVDAGATVVHETTLEHIFTRRDGRVDGVTLRLPDGTSRVVSCDLLIGADGLRSTVARRLGIEVTRQGRHASAYVVRYLTDLDRPADSFEWLYRPGVGAGVIPTNDDTFCVFAALPPSRFATEGRSDAAGTMRQVLREASSSLSDQIDAATPIGPIRTWPGVRGQFRKAHGPGWALVGDAGYFKDPFAAHGISDAFRDAELLTSAVLTGEFAAYETRRDTLSIDLFETLDHIASYEWDMQTLPGLHRRLSDAMRDEGRALAAGPRLRSHGPLDVSVAAA